MARRPPANSDFRTQLLEPQLACGSAYLRLSPRGIRARCGALAAIASDAGSTRILARRDSCRSRIRDLRAGNYANRACVAGLALGWQYFGLWRTAAPDPASLGQQHSG